jgi:lysophospholipase L1-like esterase
MVVAVEVGLRVVLGLGHPLVMKLDPAYGYMPAPNQELHRFFSHIRTNRFGMRSDDIERAKPKGKRRILFDGDSVTFGTTFVDQGLIFTSRITKELSGRNTEVLNASAGGWAPANELGFLQAQGTFGADLVVLVLNTQDLTQPFAPYEAAVGPLRLPATAIGELWARYIAPRVFRAPVAHDPGSEVKGEPAVEVETPKVLATLSAIHRLVAANGARFAIVFSPSAGDEVTRYQGRWDKATAMLTDWAKLQRVPVVDMREAYAGHPAAELYFDGIHLKPLGHELVEKAFMRAYDAGL